METLQATSNGKMMFENIVLVKGKGWSFHLDDVKTSDTSLINDFMNSIAYILDS